MKECIVAIVFLFVMSGASAGNKIVVPAAYRNVAAYHNVPYKILFAVAMQESQRKLENGNTLPWPWTLNVGGKGMFFDTSEEIKRELLLQVESGKTNIDVGLMQINLRWHGQRAFSLIDLIRPEDNVNIGAEILAEQYDRCGEVEWWCAVGGYHSYRKTLADAYAERVKKWVELLL